MKQERLGQRAWLILRIACFGFSSGVPFYFVVKVLSVWMADVGTPKKVIGLFSLVSIPYALKVLIGPIVDVYRIPYLSRTLGQRRSWALLFQLSIILGILAVSFFHPKNDPLSIFLICTWIAISGAAQDVVLEAYRIEITPQEGGAFLASAAFSGSRIGILVAGYLPLVLAHWYSRTLSLDDAWAFSIRVFMVLMAIGILTTLCTKEPYGITQRERKKLGEFWHALKTSVLDLKRSHSLFALLSVIAAYELSFVFAHKMWTPFLFEMGYSKLLVANVELFGHCISIAGSVLGGILIRRVGTHKSLLLWSILQGGVATILLAQTFLGYSVAAFVVSTAMKQFVAGIGGTTLIVYFSSFCSNLGTATQYAFLSSSKEITRDTVSLFSGFLSEYLSWTQFFGLNVGISLPITFILLWRKTHVKEQTQR